MTTFPVPAEGRLLPPFGGLTDAVLQQASLGQYLWNNRVYNVRDFGAVGDGASDDSTAFAAAVAAAASPTAVFGGSVIRVPGGTYVTAGFALPDRVSLIGEGERASFINLTAAGGPIVLAERSRVSGLRIERAGRVLECPAGARFCAVDQCEVISSGAGNNALVFTPDGGAGFYSAHTTFAALQAGVPAIALTTADTLAVPRSFFGCSSGGTIFVDLAGMNNWWMVGCRLEGVLCSSQAAIGGLIGCRIGALVSPVVLRWTECQAVACVFSTSVQLVDSQSCAFVGSTAPDFDVTESGASLANELYKRRVYVPSWTAVTTNPLLNNGTLTGFFERNGKTVNVFVSLTMGSATNPGSGRWRLSLPEKVRPGVVMTGQAVLYDTSTANRYLIPAVASAGNQFVDLFVGAGSAAAVDAVSPFVWAAGDTLELQMTYDAR